MARPENEEQVTMERQRIREMLESCRPESDDILDPEMADAARALEGDLRLRDVFARQQRQDRQLRDAFLQVEVPADLEQRLLAALASAGGSEPAAVVERRPGRSEPLRRRWLVAALTTTASLLVLAGWWATRPAVPTLALLEQFTLEWTEALERGDGTGEDWRPFREEEFPHLRWRPLRWQPVRTRLDAEVVVFDFRAPRGARLRLFQLTTRHTLPLPKIPYQSLTVTGTWQSGAWQEGRHVFVAVTDRPQLLDALRRGYSPT
jgi:hypothetical protein